MAKMEALGMIETKGLIALIEASGRSSQGCERPNAQLGQDRQRSGYRLLRRRCRSGQGRCRCRCHAAGKVGDVVSVQVIPRPHDELSSVIPKSKVAAPAK